MSLSGAYKRLEGRCATVRRYEPLSRHTTYRVGGPASLYLECDSIEELHDAVATLESEHVDWLVLGKGSNVLVADAGYAGAVVTLGSGFRRIRVDGERIDAGAGAVLAHVVQEAFRRGLAGLEFAVGVPGTLGGAVAMNAGTADAWMGSVVSSVTMLDPARGLTSLRGSEIAWGYRRSSVRDSGVIVEVSLALSEGDKDVVRATMETSLKRRKTSQPIGTANAGSVFVNPPGESAGRLIEAAGLKGFRVGGAEVSRVHANFIVNTGSATAADIVAVIAHVRETVRTAHGIELTPEIRFVGQFEPA